MSTGQLMVHSLSAVAGQSPPETFRNTAIIFGATDRSSCVCSLKPSEGGGLFFGNADLVSHAPS